MNFEELKKEMDDSVRDKKIELDMKLANRMVSNPVQKIRLNMKKEINLQLLAIVIFMIYPIYVAMPDFSEAVYYVFMFIMSLMTMAYILKLSFFFYGKQLVMLSIQKKRFSHLFMRRV